MRPHALALLTLLTLPALSGCFGATQDARDTLVPYPRMGDIATYEASGALVEFARWENAHPFATGTGRVRFALDESPHVLDGARAVHPAFLVRTSVAEGGPFVLHSERYVSPAHQALVQAYYPLSQDQGVVSFDERGFPWLFGASVLFGEDIAEGAFPFDLPDNLGRGASFTPQWVVLGEEEVEGIQATRLDLRDAPGMEGSLWLESGSAWPVKVRLAITGDGLAPHVRADAALPATLEARRVETIQGAEPVPPRNRGASFAQDQAAPREAWDGEKPPDGEPGALPYLLSEAVRDAKLLDVQLQQWLQAAQDPRVYRATFQVEPGPVEGSENHHWLVQFVSQDAQYYETQVGRVSAPPLPTGAPRIESSGPAEPPADKNHGWFAREAAPEKMVPLAEGIRIVRDTFGADGVQVFLRSFADPAGYSYFLDGGFERDGGRYTVVYNPGTAFIEHATGPVSVRFAAE